VKLVFAEHAWEDYLYWQKTDKKILKRINLLIKDITRDPFDGIGKPEPLKHALSGLDIGQDELMMSTESYTKCNTTLYSSPSFDTTTELGV